MLDEVCTLGDTTEKLINEYLPLGYADIASCLTASYNLLTLAAENYKDFDSALMPMDDSGIDNDLVTVCLVFAHRLNLHDALCRKYRNLLCLYKALALTNN